MSLLPSVFSEAWEYGCFQQSGKVKVKISIESAWWYMRIIFALLMLIVSEVGIGADAPLREQEVEAFRFGIAPQQSMRELAKRWSPIIRYIGERSGVPLQFQSAASLADFQNEIKGGRYDITFVNAYHYAAIKKATGYRVFLQEKDAKFVGMMVVRKDSPYQSIKDLDGKQVAYPGPTFVTTMLAHTYLTANNVKVTPNYVVSMDSVYRTVAKGLFDAGQGEMRTFEIMDPAVRDQLRILWTADPLPPFAFVVHPRVPLATIRKIQDVMVKMTEDPVGVELLKAVNMKGFVEAQVAEYELMGNLKLVAPDLPP